MYEFCFSLPYGGMLLLGGVVGYLSAGSTVSLAAGGGSGALVLFLGMQSLKEYKKCKSGAVMPHEYASATRTYTMFSLIISGILTYVMGDRYLNKSAKFMPAGLIFFLSAIMSMFYIYRLVSPAPAPKDSKSQQ